MKLATLTSSNIAPLLPVKHLKKSRGSAIIGYHIIISNSNTPCGTKLG
jgi:hypothetical protein